MVATMRVSKHLETTIHDFASGLEKNDGSRPSIETWKARLTWEIVKLSQLLKEDADVLWAKFQKRFDR